MDVHLSEITSNPVETIFKAYRLCYAKGKHKDIKILSPEDQIEFIKDKLLKGHFSPLEHVSMTFQISGISRACSHQLVRHRTAKFSQQSQRYVDGSNFEFVMPESIARNRNAAEAYSRFTREVTNIYKELSMLGIPREDVRYILPNSTTTNITVTMDVNNFRKFYAQRNCKYAQNEIRVLAQQMMTGAKAHLPFVDFDVMDCGKTCLECVTD